MDLIWKYWVWISLISVHKDCLCRPAYSALLHQKNGTNNKFLKNMKPIITIIKPITIIIIMNIIIIVVINIIIIIMTIIINLECECLSLRSPPPPTLSRSCHINCISIIII